MGITVNQTYMTHAGFEIPSYYVSLCDAQIIINRPPILPTPLNQTQPSQKYMIEANFHIWVSKEARDHGRSKIGAHNVRIISETPITENVYEVLYAKLKEGFSNYTEDI
ncbi:hypothetical protein DSLPV1_063 [Dishui lake phycodnavirus 1]|uniref:hypothetical protein n=1 Tax=Dishui lake phycodnavirus 1 TaxID=2079134 RepID=UPI000CD685AE|nr:hypothetical protein C5Y57_gp063 [Dishui lake phycodnavirus 1]AUT19034.1 hypothetical protein DSLPV1_063 [Dishui lake phycodnavirus 1]